MAGQNPIGLGLADALRQVTGGLSASGVTTIINQLFPGWSSSIALGVQAFELTVAQRQNLIASPVTVVVNPGGVILYPLHLFNYRTTAGAGAAAAGSASITWETGVSTTALLSAFQLCSTATNRNDFDTVGPSGTINVPMASPTTAVGSDLLARATNNQTGGAASTFQGWLVYLSITP